MKNKKQMQMFISGGILSVSIFLFPCALSAEKPEAINKSKLKNNVIKYEKLIKTDKNYKYNPSFKQRDYPNVPKHVLENGVRKIFPTFRIPPSITKQGYEELCKKYSGLEKDGWMLTFHDEFEGNSLDKRKWFTDMLKRDFKYSEPQYLYYYYGRKREYSNSLYIAACDEKQLVFKDGILQIITEYRKNPVFYGGKNRNYVTSLLTTRMGGFNQRYGYFEIRCKLKHHPNAWPGFWLWPEGGKYKGAPGSEVDVFENWGYRNPSLAQTVNVANVAKPKDLCKKTNIKYDTWHTFSAELTPEEIIFYIDGEQTFKMTIPAAIAHDFVDVYVYNIIDGRKKAPDLETTKSLFPNILEVDYVRVYQRPEGYYEKKFSLTKAFWDGRPHLVPGILEAEWYNQGKDGESFHDSDRVNDGDVFRYDGVDIKEIGDEQYIVYNINPKEWLKYTVYFEEEGKYKLSARLASKTNAKINIKINKNDLGACPISPTGSFDDLKEVDICQFNIEKGKAEIRVDFLDNNIVIDKILIRKIQ